jgi:hypothetical protein
MPNEEDEGDVSELQVLIGVLDVLKLRIQARDLRGRESFQANQIVNEFLPGSVIGDFIQQPVCQRGDDVSGDKYEISGHAQVGAVGKGAKVKTLTFQKSNGATYEFDLEILADELQKLRAEMRKQASTTEHDRAIVTVGQAIDAAQEGNTHGVIQCLKSAGKWAIELATAISAGIAVEAIKAVGRF